MLDQKPKRGARQKVDRVEFGERFHVREAKEQKTRRWQRPREKTVLGGAEAPGREEGARVQVLSSFGKLEKTNEHTPVGRKLSLNCLWAGRRNYLDNSTKGPGRDFANFSLVLAILRMSSTRELSFELYQGVREILKI